MKIYTTGPDYAQIWNAYTDDYDGAPDAGAQVVGHGSTEHQAIEDLVERLIYIKENEKINSLINAQTKILEDNIREISEEENTTYRLSDYQRGVMCAHSATLNWLKLYDQDVQE